MAGALAADSAARIAGAPSAFAPASKVRATTRRVVGSRYHWVPSSDGGIGGRVGLSDGRGLGCGDADGLGRGDVGGVDGDGLGVQPEVTVGPAGSGVGDGTAEVAPAPQPAAAHTTSIESPPPSRARHRGDTIASRPIPPGTVWRAGTTGRRAGGPDPRMPHRLR